MKTKEEIKIEIRAAEDDFKHVFSVKNSFCERLDKWQDDVIFDMYDHNQFVPACNGDEESIPTLEDFSKAVGFQLSCGRDFLKYDSRKPLEDGLLAKLKELYGLEGEQTITMYLPEKRTDSWKKNADIEVFDAKTDDIGDVLDKIEDENFGELYGHDFVHRRTKGYINKARDNEKFYYFCAYLGGKPAGSCYAFVADGYLLIDGLGVDEKMRKKYVATTLLSYIINRFNGIPFLHADPEDTPKDMYARMGFEIIDVIYEYTALGLKPEMIK